MLKEVVWVGSSKKDLDGSPAEVQDKVGYALYEAQKGGKSEFAKPLTGFGGASVLEIVARMPDETYRAVYAVKFGETVYVLHVFQKKSLKGKQTAKADIDLVKQRLATAKAMHEKEEGSK